MGLFDRVKAHFLRKEVLKRLEPFDTEEERKAMADEKIKTGMPPMVANVLAFLGGIFQEAVVALVTSKDFAALLGDPATLLRMLLAMMLLRGAMKAIPPGKTISDLSPTVKKPE